MASNFFVGRDSLEIGFGMEPTLHPLLLLVKPPVDKIIDNLQAQINNVHLRIENLDLEDNQSTFSLGTTLKSITFYTTDT
jgi:hypothetical protein